MKPNRLWLAIASSVMASQLMAGEAVFYVTEDGEAVRDLAVAVDGKKKLVGKSGFVSFDVPAGSHTVELSQFGEYLGEFDFDTASDEQNAEIQVEMIGGEALPEINVFTPGQEAEVALGQISGYLESDDTGGPISGARVSVEGTEQGVVTDEDGFFSFELPRGEYQLLIADPNYGKRDVSGIRVMGNVNTGVNLNMSLEGDGVIEEVVAVGTYVPSTATAQERDSSAVLDSIGAEQFSRFGDSDAAAALKRVTGVTVSDGKYVVVRGLSERYSTIMLNGASLPSPDPSRRVVPLDIFPSTVLDGIDVQKTFTPDVYADSTGGVVKLKTKKFPSEFEGKLSVSTQYNDGTTFEDRELQQSQSLDFLGFGSGGDRELPSGISSSDSSAEIADKVGELPDNLETESQTILPDLSLELSMGDTLVDNGSYTLGYTASVRYSNEWNAEDREQNSYSFSESEGLILADALEQDRTENDINLGGGISFGLIHDSGEYSSNTMLLRQTHSESNIRRGIESEQDQEIIETDLLWLERQFLLQQFTGEHVFGSDFETELKWQASISQATLDSPDERRYRYERETDDSASAPYRLLWSAMDRTYSELTDDNLDASVQASTYMFNDDSMSLSLNYGLSMFTREREAESTRIGYRGPNGERRADDYPNEFNPDFIVADTINDGTTLVNGSLNSDNYDATWDMLTYNLAVNYELFDQFKVLVGARAEDSELKVNTFEFSDDPGATPTPVEADVSGDDVFTSIAATYFVNEELQLRAAFYETINRPDFRELANAQFIDPDTGDSVRGNSDLVSAEVENFDVRAEYYFSDSENVSLAYFTKDIDNPIERTSLSGGQVFSFENGENGKISGFELDWKKEFELDTASTFVSGNLAVIDSEVTIDVAGSQRKQDLQGQPKQLANLQLGYDHYDLGAQLTLVVNHQGETLDSVATAASLPNIIREPRNEVDIRFNMDMTDTMTLKASLENITDEEVELTQGGETFRSYKEGISASVGISMEF